MAWGQILAPFGIIELRCRKCQQRDDALPFFLMPFILAGNLWGMPALLVRVGAIALRQRFGRSSWLLTVPLVVAFLVPATLLFFLALTGKAIGLIFIKFQKCQCGSSDWEVVSLGVEDFFKLYWFLDDSRRI
jgi:hypothetical protein